MRTSATASLGPVGCSHSHAEARADDVAEILLTVRSRKAWRLGKYHHENEAHAIARVVIGRMQGWLSCVDGRVSLTDERE
jgi:hypothetical protein